MQKWTFVKIEFEGIFCLGDSYTTKSFNVIDEMNLCRKKREVFIRFDRKFLQQLRDSSFYKYLDHNDFKQCDAALTLRLYEFLSRNFERTNTFSVNMQSLAKNLTLSKRVGNGKYYPSDVLPKIKASLEELNINGLLAYTFDYCRITDICSFTKLSSFP